MLDRAVGVFALVAIGFVVLLFPSTLAALGGHQRGVLMFFDAILILVAPGLLLAPYFAPILERWRFTRWAGMLARVTHETFLGSAWGTLIFVVAFGMLLLSIASLWPLGRLLGLGLSDIGCCGPFYFDGGNRTDLNFDQRLGCGRSRGLEVA